MNNICISGHSAGAHLAALTVLHYPNLFTSFVGLSGVYDVRDHFGFEHQRAVEQASAMEPAMGECFQFLNSSYRTDLLEQVVLRSFGNYLLYSPLKGKSQRVSSI